MSIRKRFFNVLFAVLMCVVPVAVRASVDESDCVMYNPAFALCSTHAHNIGFIDKNTRLPVNPTAAEDTAYMNEVIALKSTVIAQQLKEQYDELNAIIKRFKTQLEKAVLTSKIEVLTGNSASGNTGGGSSGSSNTNGLANAEDCYSVDQASAYDCIARNLTKISSAAESDITNARKQLENDLAIMKGYSMCKDDAPKECLEAACNKDSVKNLNKTALQSCVKSLQLKVRNAKNKFDNDNAKARWGR